jgi:putative transposase
MSNAIFYKWRARYGGMDASMISHTKSVEEENWRFKKMFAALSMQNELLKEALGKKVTGPSAARQVNAGLRREGTSWRIASVVEGLFGC